MPKCCPCTGNGRCLRCACVKARKICDSCSPSQRGLCNNYLPTPTSVPDMLENSSHSSTLNPSSAVFTPVVNSNSSTENPTSFQDLPPYSALSPPSFTWGQLDGQQFNDSITDIYSEAIHWRRNLFNVPTGKVGKEFILELSRLIRAYAEHSALEVIALKVAMVLPMLLLQKPHPGSKSRDHCACLQQRLTSWKQGELADLLHEARTIQSQHLKSRPQHYQNDHTSHTFAKLMMAGKVKAAIRLISAENKGGVLNLDDTIPGQPSNITVFDILNRSTLILNRLTHTPYCHRINNSLILFDSIDGTSICNAALKTFSSAGPSGLDAAGWRRLCASFHSASKELCHSIALFTRRICTEYLDPQGLAAFVACRLVPLDKSPGVCPIGVCESLRRIVGKAVLNITKPYILACTGALQLCSGQEAGIEATIHAMRSIFDEDSSEAILMVDAKNAFNSLNRQTALRNIDISCPAMSHIFINTYRSGIELFVGGETLLSLEGTTQGDPLAMAMYAIASMPLIHHVSTTNANQAWYADDASAAGKLTALRQWWDKLESSGPAFGNVVNPSKTWLLVKPDLLEEGQIAFANTDVQVTTTGTHYLGSVLGTHSFVEEFVPVKATRWASEIKQLSEVARTQPHAAYCAFRHGLRSEWNFLARTTPDIAHLLQSLENVIQKSFLPALTGRNAPSTEERDLLALPARLGGLGIINPTTLEQEYVHSTLISRPLSDLIITQQTELGDAPLTQQQAKSTVRIERKKEQSANANETIGKLSDNLRRATELASE